MHFWWVYQGKSFERAFEGGYLWAPHHTKTGGSPYYYWSNVARVGVDDIIFSHVAGEIVAVSTPQRTAYNTPAPAPEDASTWSGLGWKLDVKYQLLKQPIAYEAAFRAIQSITEGTRSPFASNGRPNQGYLFGLPEEAGDCLVELINAVSPDFVFNAFQSPSDAQAPTSDTSTTSIVQTRLGQSVFRRRLDRLWQAECAVSGVCTRELLRASHSKPWGVSTDRERLDCYNGLLLAAAYDAAYDKGLISFTQSGAIIFSPRLSAEEANRAGLSTGARLRLVDPNHQKYLEYHRRHVFFDE